MLINDELPIFPLFFYVGINIYHPIALAASTRTSSTSTQSTPSTRNSVWQAEKKIYWPL